MTPNGTETIRGNDGLPLVSVVMPVRNEAAFIVRTLKSVLAQDYPPDRLEILVADGMSDDGTREILARNAEEDARLRVLDNPGRIQSTGLNIAIRAARGSIVIRVDGHAEIATDFISRNLQVLREHPETWSVGGPIVHTARTPTGKAIAVAMSHPLGVGNARHRFDRYEGYAEGVAFPAIHRWVFDRIGYFDERLTRSEDDEFNYRNHLAGGRVWVSPRIRHKYFVRERLCDLFRQYAQYGFWKVPVIRKHRRLPTVRQVVPALFFLCWPAMMVAGMGIGQTWLGAVLPLLYAAALVIAGLASVPFHGWAIACRLPLAMATMHGAYAAGFLASCWAWAFRPSLWNPSGQ